MIMKPVDFAMEEIGIKEWKEGSNPRIIEYHAVTTLGAKDDAIPWCASFVSWCIEKARLKGFNVPSSTRSAAARSYLKWSKSSLKNPQYGDVCIFQRGQSAARTGSMDADVYHP